MTVNKRVIAAVDASSESAWTAAVASLLIVPVSVDTQTKQRDLRRERSDQPVLAR